MNTDSQRAEFRTFVERIVPLLAPSYGEILTEETRKTQRILLAIAGLLYLLTLEVVNFSGAIEFAGLKFAVDARQTLQKVGAAVCLYFLVLYVARAYTEWSLYQSKMAVAQLDLDELAHSLRQHPKETEEYFSGSWGNLTTNQGVPRGGSAPTEVERIAKNTEIRESFELRTLVWSRKHAWFTDQLAKHMASRRLRLVVEVAFPIGFAGLSLFLVVRG